MIAVEGNEGGRSSGTRMPFLSSKFITKIRRKKYRVAQNGEKHQNGASFMEAMVIVDFRPSRFPLRAKKFFGCNWNNYSLLDFI